MGRRRGPHCGPDVAEEGVQGLAERAEVVPRVYLSAKAEQTLKQANRLDRRLGCKIRTYLPGRSDERIMPFKTAKTIRGLARHLTGKTRKSPVIAKVAHVKQPAGWKEKDFAPVI